MKHPQVAIILSQFPRYDETFLLRELVELERQGVVFSIYSLKPCRDRVVHTDAERLQQWTRYAPLSSPAVWWSVVRAVCAHPVRTCRSLAGIVRHFRDKPPLLIRSIAVWIKALHFGRQAARDGVHTVHGGWATYPATVAWTIWRIWDISYTFAGHAHDIYVDTTMLAEKIRTARAVVTCTADNVRYLSQFADGRTEHIHVNHHGLDLTRFRQAENAGASPDGAGAGPRPSPPTVPPTIVSVGSLLECKGFTYLMRACRLLRDRGLEVRCVIAGGGPLEGELRAQVEAEGLQECVQLLGYVNQDQVLACYERASALALPAVLEIHWGIPNVVIEAMAMGLPTICTGLPSIPELYGGPDEGEGNTRTPYQVMQRGIIVPDKNPEALADALERLLTDAGLAGRLVERGQPAVREGWDIVKTGAQLKEILLGA